MCSGIGDWTASAASAWRRPFSSPTGCRPRASSRSSRPASRGLLARAAQRAAAACGVVLELAQRQLERLAEHDEPLLRAVVQVAADAPALLVGGAAARGRAAGQLVGAHAQRRLVAAALQLGGGAGSEHLQRLQLLRRRVAARRGRSRRCGRSARPSAARSASAR